MSNSSDNSHETSARGLLLKGSLLALVLAMVGGLLLMRHHAPPKTAPWPTVARSNLVMRAGCWYPLASTNRFTGWMEGFYPDGSRLSRTAISNGLLNGVCESWFTNSQIQSREYFKNSVSNGRREKWYANGQLESQANIVNGKMEGVFRRWYKNGQLAEQIKMKNGQPDGLAWAYYPSGFAKAKTDVRSGKVLDRKVWKDGERREANLTSALAEREN